MGYLIVGKYNSGKEGDIPEIIEREYYGQGMIFKDEEVYKEHPKQVCYVPELSDSTYTRQDFLNLCNGNESMAEELFEACDWQHPESLLEDWIVNGEWESCDNCGTLFDCSSTDSCPNCSKPVFSEEPIFIERWYEEDLAAAMEKAKISVTRENLNRMKEGCEEIFEDNVARNEMLADKAYEIFRREE